MGLGRAGRGDGSILDRFCFMCHSIYMCVHNIWLYDISCLARLFATIFIVHYHWPAGYLTEGHDRMCGRP